MVCARQDTKTSIDSVPENDKDKNSQRQVDFVMQSVGRFDNFRAAPRRFASEKLLSRERRTKYCGLYLLGCISIMSMHQMYISIHPIHHYSRWLQEQSLPLENRQESRTVKKNVTVVANGVNNSVIDKLQSRNAFAACLMWKDDNHHLVEWLAYHYQMLPLRRLIVCTDSTAKGTPEFILQRYQSRNLMEISILNDTDIFGHDHFTKNLRGNVSALPPERQVHTHRDRQRRCMRLCFQQLHTEHWSWVASHDVDEYLVVKSTYLQTGSNRTENLMAVDKDHTERDVSLQPTYHQEQQLQPRQQNSTKTTPTIWELLHTTQKHATHWNGSHIVVSDACVPLSRPMFGSREQNSIPSNATLGDRRRAAQSVAESYTHQRVLQSLDMNSNYLMTYRWKWHTPIGLLGSMGKALVDISKIVPMDLKRLNSTNPHRPVKKLCSRAAVWAEDTFFQLHHYAGSMEQWLHREDPRRIVEQARTQDLFHELANMSVEFDDDALGWITGLIHNLGKDAVKALLAGNGQLNHPSHQVIV